MKAQLKPGPVVIAVLFVVAGWVGIKAQSGEERRVRFQRAAELRFGGMIGTGFIYKFDYDEDLLVGHMLERPTDDEEIQLARSLAMSYSSFAKEQIGARQVTVILLHNGVPVRFAKGKAGACTLVGEGAP